jgi:hypothetical protein
MHAAQQPDDCPVGASVVQKYMVIDDLWPKTYYAIGIPSTLRPAGSTELVMPYIGESSGLPGISDGNKYWESDSFDVTCESGVDTYLWRLVAGTSDICKAGGGTNNVYLYLVHDGSASTCEFNVARCDLGAGTVTDPAVAWIQYRNIADFRARCGSSLNLSYPQLQARELEAMLSCTVCVYPKNLPPIEPTECLTDYLALSGRTEPLPNYLRVEVVSITNIDTDPITTIPLITPTSIGKQWLMPYGTSISSLGGWLADGHAGVVSCTGTLLDGFIDVAEQTPGIDPSWDSVIQNVFARVGVVCDAGSATGLQLFLAGNDVGGSPFLIGHDYDVESSGGRSIDFAPADVNAWDVTISAELKRGCPMGDKTADIVFRIYE